MRHTIPFSLRAVNGWRGPGALAIAIAHFAVAMDTIPTSALQPIALVVDLFFVLSGVLIAQVYLDRLTSPAAIPEYVVRRFGRIWPVHAVMLGILVAYEFAKLVIQTTTGKQFTVPAFAADSAASATSLWSNLLLLHSVGLNGRETWNFPSWSLSVEFVTYVAFSAFCLVSPVRRRFLTVATILVSLAILGLVAPQHMRSTFDYGLFRCLAGFFAGTLLFDALSRWRMPSWPAPTLVEFATLGLVVAWMAIANGTALTLLAPIVFSLFVAVFVQERGLLSRVLRQKPLQAFAELSFTIYMVHAVILIFTLAALHEVQRHFKIALFVPATGARVGESVHLGNHIEEAALMAGYVAVVVASAYLTFRMIEIPGRAMFNTLGKRLSFPDIRPAVRPLEPTEPGP